MTKTELVPPNKTKTTTNDMHHITGKREAIVTSKTVLAWPLEQVTFKKSFTIYLE